MECTKDLNNFVPNLIPPYIVKNFINNRIKDIRNICWLNTFLWKTPQKLGGMKYKFVNSVIV